MSGPTGLTQRELLDLFDRCEAHPTIRAAIRGVLTGDAAIPPVLVTEETLAEGLLDSDVLNGSYYEQPEQAAAAILRHLREGTE